MGRASRPTCRVGPCWSPRWPRSRQGLPGSTRWLRAGTRRPRCATWLPRWPGRRRGYQLSSPTEIASVPGAALAIALVLVFAAGEDWPLWPALAATAATLLTVELLAGRLPAASGASLAQSLVLGIGLAAAAPRLGWASGGATLLAGSLVLLEWHARRRPDPPMALVVLAVAAAGLALAMAEPWTAVTAAAVTAAWAHTRRIRRLPGPFGRSAEWAVGLALAGCLAPLAL